MQTDHPLNTESQPTKTPSTIPMIRTPCPGYLGRPFVNKLFKSSGDLLLKSSFSKRMVHQASTESLSPDCIEGAEIS
jgi:hypothetical protein